ncbi:TPA: hypothetical protein DEO28_02215 [Candidatus Dependentiae bacterium]|nr:MAG: hypothetical protein UR14_C0009G0010 [candidate division TM6 bacterium GW2011_GWE2_31_21]KKP52549.1 MAG: hypothetical protein UR43_C0012G0018 [candidate division TM6 bacterium GW2011_GWF2_33_332]HBS48455.1 hypothetical protein [Candidatus Dependentiae bacterium]HBZ73304.1 hypothetical protein [Candidatus Dependentiae bacterium]
MIFRKTNLVVGIIFLVNITSLFSMFNFRREKGSIDVLTERMRSLSTGHVEPAFVPIQGSLLQSGDLNDAGVSSPMEMEGDVKVLPQGLVPYADNTPSEHTIFRDEKYEWECFYLRSGADGFVSEILSRFMMLDDFRNLEGLKQFKLFLGYFFRNCSSEIKQELKPLITRQISEMQRLNRFDIIAFLYSLISFLNV